jgi:hypothetical protein
MQEDHFIPGEHCITTARLLTAHILADLTVQYSWFRERRYLGYIGDALLFSNMENRNYRYHAYRNYIDFMHGYLGKRNRRVIPACVVSLIRQKWPDPHGNYIGYEEIEDEDLAAAQFAFPDELAGVLEEA